MNRNPNPQDRLVADLMLSLSKHEGFKYLMNRLDIQGNDLIASLTDATDRDDISTSDRKELVWQIATHLKYNRMLRDEIDKIVMNGKTDEELRDLGLL